MDTVIVGRTFEKLRAALRYARRHRLPLCAIKEVPGGYLVLIRDYATHS